MSADERGMRRTMEVGKWEERTGLNFSVLGRVRLLVLIYRLYIVMTDISTVHLEDEPSSILDPAFQGTAQVAKQTILAR